ncbi:MAG: hypothetical protein M1829_004841 [Trizodia sp. TS-e1964]|nr:MAG: hypothetical protein M1829_004841 [Trizodia sp. TS-e1964]
MAKAKKKKTSFGARKRRKTVQKVGPRPSLPGTTGSIAQVESSIARGRISLSPDSTLTSLSRTPEKPSPSLPNFPDGSPDNLPNTAHDQVEQQTQPLPEATYQMMDFTPISSASNLSGPNFDFGGLAAELTRFNETLEDINNSQGLPATGHLEPASPHQGPRLVCLPKPVSPERNGANSTVQATKKQKLTVDHTLPEPVIVPTRRILPQPDRLTGRDQPPQPIGGIASDSVQYQIGAQQNPSQVRIKKSSQLPQRVFPRDPLDAATDEDKSNWKGWCEIESDPAIFSTILQDLGVKGIKIEECLGTSEGLLDMLAKPVYGLIWLYQFHDSESDKQVESCPSNVWFANQTVTNACATVALFNIINNIPGIELGPHLRSFKEFTQEFDPSMRGYSIGMFDFARDVHNSFARKMDMLNSDLLLKVNSSKFRGKSSKLSATDEDEAVYHFVAFVPIGNEVWKLDGLNRQPENLGTFTGSDWLQLATRDIEAWVAAQDDQSANYSLLGLCQDPRIQTRHAIATTAKELNMAIHRLNYLLPNWLEFSQVKPEDILLGPDKSLGLTREHIDNAQISECAEEIFSGGDADKLFNYCAEISNRQGNLISSLREEDEAVKESNRCALNRRHDYGPFIRKWLGNLANKGLLKGLCKKYKI